MSALLRLTIFVIALVYTIGNLYLMTRKKLGERTTILWLFGTIAALFVAMFPGVLNRVAAWVGVDYPPALLYLVAILVLLTIVIYQSTQISQLDHRLREIGQSVAILEAKLHQVSAPRAAAENQPVRSAAGGPMAGEGAAVREGGAGSHVNA
ncbi:DUF2304 domain-containing protein [Alicyclobacillus cycloheptanicus]|uniref:DUF2304 domain-containing protein n=1 Tax=Alicyclobacillus cycloheptanicus TaxID=1457 RepID=A0ABT9XJ16_9BACL|nr:DUF2304 domain-containing protein [Alicyclobacillus cycloheptanicus]MDQ0190115.1 hypothetical protein [Alicyclobacillus cycloheptanicus]WDM02087.1 DUF2304 domain-containing protein [Alicyclobacillus cycloheptanicus]